MAELGTPPQDGFETKPDDQRYEKFVEMTNRIKDLYQPIQNLPLRLAVSWYKRIKVGTESGTGLPNLKSLELPDQIGRSVMDPDARSITLCYDTFWTIEDLGFANYLGLDGTKEPLPEIAVGPKFEDLIEKQLYHPYDKMIINYNNPERLYQVPLSLYVRFRFSGEEDWVGFTRQNQPTQDQLEQIERVVNLLNEIDYVLTGDGPDRGYSLVTPPLSMGDRPKEYRVPPTNTKLEGTKFLLSSTPPEEIFRKYEKRPRGNTKDDDPAARAGDGLLRYITGEDPAAGGDKRYYPNR